MRRCETRISASNTTAGAPVESHIHKTRLDENMRSVNNRRAQNAAGKRKQNGNANRLSANNRNAPAQNAVGKRRQNMNAGRLSAKGKSALSRNGRRRNMSV